MWGNRFTRFQNSEATRGEVGDGEVAYNNIMKENCGEVGPRRSDLPTTFHKLRRLGVGK